MFSDKHQIEIPKCVNVVTFFINCVMHQYLKCRTFVKSKEV